MSDAVRTAIWGIDVSTKAISLAVHDGQRGTPPMTLQLDKKAVGANRLSLAYEQMRIWFRQRIHEPELIVVEDPMGPFSKGKPALERMVGVCQLALAGLFACPILELSPPQWKALIGLKGNADKSAVMAWAREYGYEGEVQDEADALGIAAAGFALLERDRLRAAA